ncbi:hypothetical protein R2601_03958 [Salipiger bermudensis HTCC2601]|uniref:Uncharacterized protein n=1 Tax=Salipiger bermudensis (strain DSM 26914 / JCM 13377 / KCTC 12554 / HTCC2601) TaxID=314265 RepID=Q0FW54_SALBH|nr:hypothetical protein R2601_03958 [Salipiger bermudensis HTCC2601]
MSTDRGPQHPQSGGSAGLPLRGARLSARLTGRAAACAWACSTPRRGSRARG